MARSASASAVAVVEELSAEELTALLQRQGFAETGSAVPRIVLKGATLTTPDGAMYVYNPRKPDVPAMTVRILKPLEDYYVIWIDADIASAINRPDLDGMPSKRWIKQDKDREEWESDKEFDRIKTAGFKPKYSGDLLVAIMPDDGEFKGNETPHVLTLSATSMSEFKGYFGAPEGYVSDLNFIQKLSRFAVKGAKDKAEAEKMLLDGLTSYQLGGVVAEIRPTLAERDDKNWTVLVFDPVHIEPLNNTPAIVNGLENDPEDPGL